MSSFREPLPGWIILVFVIMFFGIFGFGTFVIEEQERWIKGVIQEELEETVIVYSVNVAYHYNKKYQIISSNSSIIENQAEFPLILTPRTYTQYVYDNAIVENCTLTLYWERRWHKYPEGLLLGETVEVWHLTALIVIT
jgi:hypothetical protein